ncbi:PfkB family carbohydrate kinase [Rugosimonospora africana]|uniref:Carbohydrate kinase n=1 Tax=Rugosimonospora africana TaxID=556532 RepID=A0A8J3R255_9ACTN|nr:PfkB family carbohydrate kinase [Rugosimonospora africana]GIH20866.1 carbohydrate kinase [Rugosimonospora africana]
MIERLVHVGNVVIDLVMNVPALPVRGGDMLAHSSQVTAGGGYNVMTAARRQGLPVTYAGAHGTGPFGDLARRQLAEAGIDIAQPATAGVDTGFDVALVDAQGERTFATSLGAEARLERQDLDAVPVGPSDAVYVSGYGLVYPSNGPAIAGWLGGLPDRTLVVTDPGPLVSDIPEPVRDAVLKRTDWWSANLREAQTLTGQSDPVRAAEALSERTGRSGVLVRIGPDGAVVKERGRPAVVVPGFPVAQVDANGAGDAHVGVFIAGLAHGLSPVEAVRRANAAAAIAVTRSGPATAPTAAETDEFLAAARALR